MVRARSRSIPGGPRRPGGRVEIGSDSGAARFCEPAAGGLVETWNLIRTSYPMAAPVPQWAQGSSAIALYLIAVRMTRWRTSVANAAG